MESMSEFTRWQLGLEGDDTLLSADNPNTCQQCFVEGSVHATHRRLSHRQHVLLIDNYGHRSIGHASVCWPRVVRFELFLVPVVLFVFVVHREGAVAVPFEASDPSRVRISAGPEPSRIREERSLLFAVEI
jgi:hypothetical protein